MKLIKIIIIIFLALTIEINADTEKEIINNLAKGGNLIFIRHAYAPGNGDPENFDINNCETQRNLSQSGRLQSKKIGNFFKENDIPIKLVISSEWCRCKETAEIAFKKFETKNFLNSFFRAAFFSLCLSISICSFVLLFIFFLALTLVAGNVPNKLGCSTPLW